MAGKFRILKKCLDCDSFCDVGLVCCPDCGVRFSEEVKE